ncbi:MAG: hypothetical protein JST54_32980 [Deltaproteobacteria bacterium]|nr:hypothetical protein [Deltaproteobacteria bacterium]
MPVHRFSMKPLGPFSLTAARDYFERWPEHEGGLAVAFPVEGWQGTAAAVVRLREGRVEADIHCDAALADTAWKQLLAALSLDFDGTDFPKLAERDPVLGKIQRALDFMRPMCSLTPYEAAVARVLGQRRSIVQQRAIRKKLADARGDKFELGPLKLAAFPRPQVLLEVDAIPGVDAKKLAQLHSLAHAALAGKLDRERLRALPYDDALAELREMPGVGDWTSQGIMLRGAALVDTVPDDGATQQAVQFAYGLKEQPSHAEVLKRAEAWRPFRMWAVVLLHIWLRREGGGPRRDALRKPRRRA